MTEAVYWIWLQNALKQGNVKALSLLKLAGSPENIFNMTRTQLLETKLFSENEARKIQHDMTLDFAKRQLDAADKCGCSVLTPDSDDYPQCFRGMDALALALYVKGSLAGLENELVITMVGTRDCTPEGQETTAKLSYDLTAAGCTIASGLAVGIDYAAHEGALILGGRTIGMLACGADVNYPAASKQLKKRILDCGGAIFSEFFFGARPEPYHFNIRNRLMAGISSGVVVTQAPLRSGAMNTAHHALSQGLDVFSLPGDIFDTRMAGCNALIGDGAKMVLNVYSILEEYRDKFPSIVDVKTTRQKIMSVPALKSGQLDELKLPSGKGLFQRMRSKAKARKRSSMPLNPANDGAGSFEVAVNPKGRSAKPPAKVELPQAVSDEARVVFEKIGDTPASCDELRSITGLTMSNLLVALTELEMFGVIRSLPGQKYIR